MSLHTSHSHLWPCLSLNKSHGPWKIWACLSVRHSRENITWSEIRSLFCMLSLPPFPFSEWGSFVQGLQANVPIPHRRFPLSELPLVLQIIFHSTPVTWEMKPKAQKKGPYSRLLTRLKNALGCCWDHPDWSILSRGAAEKDANGGRRLTVLYRHLNSLAN